MRRPEPFPTHLELRETNADGSEGAGLSHTPGGLFLYRVLELAAEGEPRGGVTILHDAGDHGARYEGLAQMLALDGWASSMPDQRGHGDSEGERGHSSGFAEVSRDLVAVQDHLCFMFPDSPKVLIGQGLGALYALGFALELPERAQALVLCAPLLMPGFKLPESKGGLMGLFKKIGPRSPGSIGWSIDQLTSDLEQQQLLRTDKFRHDVITLQAGQAVLKLAQEVLARAAEIQVPVLVLQGAGDRIAEPGHAQRLASPGRQIKTYDGMLHDLLHDVRREHVMTDVRAWLNQVFPR